MEIALLDNKKTIANLVEVDIHDSILGSINKELAKDEYNFVVTSDDVPKAKNILADLNKSKDVIDTFRKTKVASESLNIDLLKDNCKIYIDLFDAKREEIKKKFEVFEKEKKAKITKELSLYADKAVKDANLRYEFSKVDTADLIKLGSVNPGGSLKKSTIETIDGRVLACKSKQDKYDMRLMQLENESRKAGLEAILTITHVQGIISLDSDAEYQTRLNGLIECEMNRQNTIKENLQKEADEKAQREANQNVLNEQNRIKDILFVDFTLLNIDNIDTTMNLYKDEDLSIYNEFRAFAENVVSDNIVRFNRVRTDLIEADKLAKSQKSVVANNKEIPVVHETIPKDTPKVEEGRKIVRVMAIWAIEVPIHVSDEAVLNKVNKELEKRDAKGDSFESLEVI